MTDHNQRRDFLALKVKMNVPLTDVEQRDFDLLKNVRVTITTGNVLVVEPMPVSVDDWKRTVQHQRGTQPQLVSARDA